MKHLLGIFFLFFVFQSTAQRYILFNPVCMERLKYDSNSEFSTETTVYAVKINANEKLFFEVSKESQTITKATGAVITCNTPSLSRALVDLINNSTGGDQYYIVIKEGQSVLRTFLVTTASYIKINADRTDYVTKNLSFSFSNNQARNEQNIADGTSNSGVFYIGATLRECKANHAFSVTSGTDLTIIPEIGVTEYKTTFANNGNAVGTRKLTTINGTAISTILKDLCVNKTNDRVVENNSVENNSEPSFGGGSGNGNSKYGSIAGYNRPGYYPSDSETEFYDRTPERNNGSTRTNSTHIVRSKETLYGIARQYGVTVAELKSWNNLIDNSIHTGDQLKVVYNNNISDEVVENPANLDNSYSALPAWEQGVAYHTKRSGETLKSIAQKYGFTEARLRYINALTSNEDVPTGYRLKITDCEPIVAPKKSSKSVELTMDDEFDTKGEDNFRTSVTSPAPYDNKDARKVNYNTAAKTYIVKENDTLYSIAKRYNTTVQKLVDANNFESANEILIPEQTIIIR